MSIQNEKVLKYLLLDKSIREANASLSVIRKEKKQLETEILQMMTEADTKMIVVKESNTVLQMKQRMSAKAMNMASMLELLKYVDPTSEQPQEWVHKLFDIREKKEVRSLTVIESSDVVISDDEEEDAKIEKEESDEEDE